jgi:hypothetical protein
MTILAESFSMLESALVGWSASNRRNCETEASSEMAPAAQASLELRGGEMHGFSRADILGRYRRYRNLRMDIQTAALESIPHSSFLAHARRIGLSDGKVLFTDDTVELSLAFDLAVYTASAGRTRAIDRCIRRRLPASKPDEALVLEALQASWFSIFRTVGRCDPAGVLLEDLMRGGAIPLVDEGLEQSAEPGAVFAMRVAPIEEFVITCGAVVPIDHATMEECIALLISAASKAELAALADHRRFAASIYELAIELGLMNFVAYR